MITLKIFEGDEDLGQHVFLSVPSIGDKLMLNDPGRGLAPYVVVAIRHFPMSLQEEGGKPGPEVWLHVEFDI